MKNDNRSPEAAPVIYVSDQMAKDRRDAQQANAPTTATTNPPSDDGCLTLLLVVVIIISTMVSCARLGAIEDHLIIISAQQKAMLEHD